MQIYNLDVFGTNETHLIQAGEKSLVSGEVLVYSGPEEEFITGEMIKTSFTRGCSSLYETAQ